nr:hypothetical protein [Proteiniphilum saccharofermentans]
MRSEVDPEMGRGRMPHFVKRHNCLAYGTDIFRRCFDFCGVNGIETNNIYSIISASREERIYKLCVPTESGRVGKRIKMKMDICG